MLLSDLLRSIVEKIENFSKRDFWVGLGLVFLVVALFNGISFSPFQPYQQASENPSISEPNPEREGSLQETIMQSAVVFLTRSNSPWPYYGLCLAILIGGFALLAGLACSRLGVAPAFLFTSVLLTSPLTTILLSRLGTPDGLTFVFTIPFLFVTSGPLLFLLAILGSIHHLAVPLAAIEILILRIYARDGVTLRHIIFTAVGGGMGTILIRALLVGLEISAPSGVSVFPFGNPALWSEVLVKNLPMIFFSMFNIHWLILMVILATIMNYDKRLVWTLMGIIIVNCLFALQLAESTRFFSLLSWGVLVESLLLSHRLTSDKGSHPRRLFLQAITAVGLASFFTPRFYGFNGKILAAPFYEFINRFINKVKTLL